MKRRWIVVALITGVLALAITGGAVMAQEGGTSGDSPGKTLVARVAEILGLDEATVQDAVNQAVSEMQDEALQQRLAHMVENGVLTQEQADEYLTWYQARPEGPFPGRLFRGMGGHGPMRGWMMGGRGPGGGFHMPFAPMPPPDGTSGTTGTSL